MKDRSFETVKDIKIISLLLIILSHCMFFYDDNPFFVYKAEIYSPSVSYAVGILDSTLVAAYVFCAGFLFARSQDRHDRPVPTVLKGRVKRLLVPYYVYGALWLVPLYTYFDIVAFGRPEHAGYLEGYRTMALGQFSEQLWFLWMLFDISVIFAFMRKLINRNRLVATGLITLAAALVVSLFLQNFPYIKLSQIAPYLLCYFAGVCVYRCRKKIDSVSPRICILIVAVLFAALCVYMYYDPQHWAFAYIQKPLGALLHFFLFCSVVSTGTWEKFKASKVFGYFEKFQMDFYLLHMPFPILIFRLLDPYIGKQPWLCVVSDFILVLFVTAIAAQIKTLLVRLLKDVKNKLLPAKVE